jgi:hypothetical protein
MSRTRLSRRGFIGGTAGLVVIGGAHPAHADTYPVTPYLPTPPHLIEAEQFIDYLTLTDGSRNTYKAPNQPNIVTWGLPGQPGTWVNQSQCASFQTAVLKRTYGWATDEFFTQHFDLASPFARDYQAAFATKTIPHLTRVTKVADLRPGDLVAIDYRNDQDTNTGHIVMVRRVKGTYVAPFDSLNFVGETQYAVEVADCTAEPHGMFGFGNYASFPDNRIVDSTTEHDGVGYGHMMFYASESTGAFTRYRWSVNTASAGTYTVAQRPVSAVRVA